MQASAIGQAMEWNHAELLFVGKAAAVSAVMAPFMTIVRTSHRSAARERKWTREISGHSGQIFDQDFGLPSAGLVFFPPRCRHDIRR